MHKRKFISLFLVFSLMLGLAGFHNSYAESGTTIQLSLSPATEGRFDYFSNEEMLIYLDLDLSGYDANIPNPSLTLSVPDKYLGLFQGSEIGSAVGPPTSSGENGITRLTYDFSQLTGGTSIRIPIRIKTTAGITPDGYVLPVDATLSASDGGVLATAATINLNQMVREPSLVKWKFNNSYMDESDGTISFGGMGSVDNPKIIDPASATKQLFYFAIRYESLPGNMGYPDYVGVRKYEKVVISDTLPVGATFDPAENPGWTYDDQTNTVTFVIEDPWLAQGTPWASYLKYEPLVLRFPGADTSNTFTNTATAEFIPLDKQSYEGENTVSSDSIGFYLTTDLPAGMHLMKFASRNPVDQIADKSKPLTWYCYGKNTSSDVNLQNLVMEDYGLDPRLKYDSVKFPGGDTSYVGNIRIEAIDQNGGITVIADNVPYQNANTFDVPDGTARIRISSLEDGYLKPMQYFFVYVQTSLIDPASVHYDTTNHMNNYMYNQMEMTGTYQGTGTSTRGQVTGTAMLQPYAPTAYLQKSGGYASLFVGERTTFNLLLRSDAAPSSPDVIQGQYVIDLLPQGLEYVPGTTWFWDGSGNDNNNVLKSSEPAVVVNYKGSGRTALIWEFDEDVKAPNYNWIYLYLYFQVEAKKEMKEGINTNLAYWIWNNNGTGEPGTQQVDVYGSMYGNAVSDFRDFDNDGNFDEPVAVSSAYVTFIPPREVIATKYVQGSLDSDYALTGGRSELDADSSFRIRIWNNSITNLSKLTAVDVLPYPGDKTLVANTQGEYLPRGSAYTTTLTGPIQGPDGFVVHYTTELPSGTGSASTSDYATSANWIPASQVMDWSAIKGIKIVMVDGEQLGVGEEVLFDVPVHTPKDPTLPNGSVANNTFAVSMNGGRDFLEAPVSSLVVQSYQVKGTAFQDLDKNGLMDQGEKPFGGVVVKLFRDDGLPALDLDGHPIQTTTGADGTYELSVYRQGNYYLSFDTPDNHGITIQGPANNGAASHIGQNDGRTGTFSLTADNSPQIRNAGYTPDTSRFVIEKIFYDVDGQPSNEPREVNMTVTLDGIPYEGPAQIDGKPVQISGGQLSFQSGQTVVVSDVIVGTQVEVVEAPSDRYRAITPTDGEYSFIQGIRGSHLLFENRLNPGTLKIDKVLLDAGGDPLDEERSFSLFVQGPSYPNGTWVTVTNKQPLTMTDLKHGYYTVQEVNADAYEVAYPEGVVQNATVEVTGVGEQSLTITNTEKPLGQLVIHKILRNAEGTLLIPSEISNTDAPGLPGGAEKAPGFLVEPARTFDIIVTGPSFPEGKEMTIENGKPLSLLGLVYGEYSVREVNGSDYDTTISPPLTIDVYNRYGSVVIENQEKPQGHLGIHKILRNAEGTLLLPQEAGSGESPGLPGVVKKAPGFLIRPARTFDIVVTGPSFPDGKEMTIENDRTLHLYGLIYGEYSVREVNGSDYDTTVSGPVTLSIGQKDGMATIENKEKPLGQLTIEKTLLDAKGNPLSPEEFNIKVTGPSYPDGRILAIESGTPLVLDSLIYGEYKVEELDGQAYDVTIDRPVVLDIEHKAGEINIINKEREGFAPPLQFEKKVEGNPPGDERFTFVLKALDPMAPMPNGADAGILAVTQDGPGTVVVDGWRYKKSGEYSYTLEERRGTNPDCEYDTTRYTITDAVTMASDGTLHVARTVTKAPGGPVVESIVFLNRYLAEDTEAANTGDPGNAGLLLLMAAVSLCGAALMRFRKKSKKV